MWDKSKGGGSKEASNVEIFLTSVGKFTEEFMEPVVPVELCLSIKERYVGDKEYTSHEERYVNHSLTYNIEYKSHVERFAYDVEYEYEQKTEESGVKFSWEETVAHLTIKKVESVDIKNVFLEVDESSLQEFSVQELVDEESTLGSVPPSLCT